MELPTITVHGKPYYWDERLQQLRSKVDFPEPIDFIDIPNKVEFQLALLLSMDNKEDLGWVVDAIKEFDQGK